MNDNIRQAVIDALVQDLASNISEGLSARPMRDLLVGGHVGFGERSDEDLVSAFEDAGLGDEHPELWEEIREASQGEIDRINSVCFAEGWALFNDGDIQKDDEAGIFLTDADAIDHIKRLADAGSAPHKRALIIDSQSARGTGREED